MLSTGVGRTLTEIPPALDVDAPPSVETRIRLAGVVTVIAPVCVVLRDGVTLALILADRRIAAGVSV